MANPENNQTSKKMCLPDGWTFINVKGLVSNDGNTCNFFTLCIDSDEGISIVPAVRRVDNKGDGGATSGSFMDPSRMALLIGVDDKWVLIISPVIHMVQNPKGGRTINIYYLFETFEPCNKTQAGTGDCQLNLTKEGFGPTKVTNGTIVPPGKYQIGLEHPTL